MDRTFHPYPIGGALKTAIIAAFFLIVAFLLRDYIKDYLIHVTLAIVLLALVRGALYFLFAHFHTIILNHSSVTYRSGIISRHEVTIPYSKVSEAKYSQGLIDRILNVGSLRVDSPGGTNEAIYLADIRMSDIKLTIDTINVESHKSEDRQSGS